jgi:uncharacterized membrane protein YbhN (UPF0104 family)
VVTVVVWRLGTGPIMDGLQSVTFGSVLAAFAVTAVTTVGSAWRWRLVARGLGVDLGLPGAVAAYYRSQFLNSVLPGGVLGDLDRGLRHGQEISDLGRSLRAVVWERVAGQVVQGVLTTAVVISLASPLRPSILVVVVVLVAVALVVAGLSRRRPNRLARTVVADIRHGLLAPAVAPGIVLASTVVVVGHATIFFIAARTAGVTASLATLLPLMMAVLLAMSVPTNVGGWGPREGVAAWVFGAAGLDAGSGLAAATVFGVIALIATLPGAVVMVVGWAHGRRSPSAEVPAAMAQPVGVAHG